MMLRQMRRRMIGMAMAAFSAVILLIVILVNAFNYAEVSRRADRTIDSVRSFEEDAQKHGEEDKPLRDALMLLRFEHSQKTGKKDTKILSDKNLDAIVVNKPTDIESLTAIIGKTSAYYIGQEILKLVIDHINNL